mmetsp:Transcript_17774/g.36884  ORF Transcript_17774/g.36884 Transcript_17774/m.36884 type:complete len:135 (-) Transcript_17774:64-468(-)
MVKIYQSKRGFSSLTILWSQTRTFQAPRTRKDGMGGNLFNYWPWSPGPSAQSISWLLETYCGIERYRVGSLTNLIAERDRRTPSHTELCLARECVGHIPLRTWTEPGEDTMVPTDPVRRFCRWLCPVRVESSEL